MIDDIAIDTNVLVHAENPAVDYHHGACELLNRLLDATTLWCLDEGFDLNEPANRSRLYSEYRARLLPTDLGLQVLATLAGSDRVKVVRRPNAGVRQKIRQMISTPNDRWFLEVAYASTAQVLISHDWNDFPQARRAEIDREFGVSVCTAEDGTRFIQE